MKPTNNRLTLANKITIARVLLIPVFVWLTLDYVRDVRQGVDSDWKRVTACLIFAVAAISDAVDGYIARRYQQKTELGAFLDPLADKALLISALVLLSRDNGTAFEQLPLWFGVLVISRDAILLAGGLLIHLYAGRVVPRPRLVGKCATFFQMITLGWVLLQIPQPSFRWPLLLAGVFTFASGIWYVFDGVKQLSSTPAARR